MPLHRPALALAALVALLAACPSRDDRRESADPDEDGRPRIVTLTPSSTEIVAAAGGTDALVGVDRYSEHPKEVRDLPEVGDFLQPSFEAILELEPDLVVLDRVQSKVVEGLASAGIDTLVLRMHTLDDVREGLREVGDALGTEDRARAAIARIDAAVDGVRARARQRRRDDRPSVLLVIDRQLGGLGDLVAASSGSYLDELLAIAGAENALAGAGLRYAKISPEQVMKAEPDIILDASHTDDVERARSDWDELSSVPAVERGRVHILEGRYYVSPGPRADRALRGLEARIYGGDEESDGDAG